MAWRGRCPAMPRTSPFVIRLSSAGQSDLQRRAGNYTLPYFQVQHARMVLLVAEGLTNEEIAARLDSRRGVVGWWRKRFFVERLMGLEEQARPGQPEGIVLATIGYETGCFQTVSRVPNCRLLFQISGAQGVRGLVCVPLTLCLSFGVHSSFQTVTPFLNRRPKTKDKKQWPTDTVSKRSPTFLTAD